jgi:hypothetical protein
MNRPLREDRGVGRLHVRVRPDHCGDAPVEPAASAAFSLVASAWTSTSDRCLAAGLVGEVVDDSNIEVAG